jgi:hypothetical protein
LSHFPHALGESQRFHSKTTAAVTFAEDLDWPRILNTAIALIRFMLDADENWSFSRLGTHCLENLFGFVRRNSLGDDQFGPILGIITKATLVDHAMHHLNLEIKHSSHDNIGGTLIHDKVVEFTELRPEVYFRSLIHLAGPEIVPADQYLILMPLPEIKELLAEWAGWDHHDDDPICNAATSPVSNCRITARNIGSG